MPQNNATESRATAVLLVIKLKPTATTLAITFPLGLHAVFDVQRCTTIRLSHYNIFSRNYQMHLIGLCATWATGALANKAYDTLL